MRQMPMMGEDDKGINNATNKQLKEKCLLLQRQVEALQNKFEGARKPTALIRSHTFTRSPAQSPTDGDNDPDASLEEISLKVMKSILTEKSELVQQYSQMVELQLNDGAPKGNTLLLHNDIQRRITKLEQLNREACRQRLDLKTIVADLEKRQSSNKVCSTCNGTNALNNSVNIDNRKYNESDLSEAEALDSLTKWGTPADSTSYHEVTANATSSAFTPDNHNLTRGSSNDAEEKIEFPDENENTRNHSPNRVCPICGDNFLGNVDFKVFEKHVEDHFVGDEDFLSLEDNYEIVTNVIGSNFH